MSLASCLFSSSLRSTDHLVRSIVSFETFELDSHFACVSSNKLFYHQELGVYFDKEFGQLLLYSILSSSGPFHEPRMVTFLHGCLSCL